MTSDVLTQEKRLLNRNKWTYSVGGIGRDMVYQLVATFFITYIQFALDLSTAQFSVIGVLLIIGRVWDGINDPIMGGIVDNTRSKWGKFKPWILTGAILTGIAIILMFNFRPDNGWHFVIFFGIIYFFWEIAFTLNDIPYWSLLPNLAEKKKDRDQITMLVVVFAALGAFLANGVISFFTVGNALQGYTIISISFVIIFLACTCLTVFGVKEPKLTEKQEKAEKISIKQMFKAIKNNDQLLWSSLALLLYTIGSNLLVALGYNFFYMELGYDGAMVMIFVATFGVSTILIQSFYAKIAKKFKRRTLLWASMLVLAFGYLMLLLIGFVLIPINLFTVCLFGAFVFGGQAVFYMVTIVNLTNTIEYNEYKTGVRNEAVMFSLRPFVTKLASALYGGVVTLVLIISGIYTLSQNVSQLEIQKNNFDTLESVELQTEYIQNITNQDIILDEADLTEEEKLVIYEALATVSYEDSDEDGLEEMIINESVNETFRDIAQDDLGMRLTLRLAITILPTILILGAYWIFKKKYIITEEFYEDMLEEISKKRKEKAEI